MSLARQRQEDLSYRVLRLLAHEPKLSLRDMAASLGVSLGGVSYCVRALAQKGLVKIDNFRAADNKLKYMYLLTPSGVAEKTLLTANFLQRKLAEYEALGAEIEAARRELGAKANGTGADA